MVIGRRKDVWIVGHSYIYWAERYAATSSWGRDLGLGALAHITWKGTRGMQWIQFNRTTAFGPSPPDVLVVHLGGNDLPRFASKALIIDILRDLNWLKRRYPSLRILWSNITPRLAWRGSGRTDAVNKARRGVNKVVRRGVCGGGLGSVIYHHRIHVSNPESFRSDGVHLSEAGLELFLEDVKGGLLCELQGLGGGHAT